MDFTIIIPARYASSRLPAKLLKDINGKTLIEHTYSNAIKSNAGRVIIATDDEKIRQVALDFGAEVCMTSLKHTSGTSRLSQVVSDLSFEDHQEQLTFIANGFDIHVEISTAETGIGVDTESDLKKVKKEFK